MKNGLIILFCFASLYSDAQVSKCEDSIVKSWLGIDNLVDDVLNNRDFYKLQIRLSTFQGDSLIKFEIGDEYYFYPASLVKLPAVLATLHKIDELGLSLEDKIILDDLEITGSKSFISKTKNGITFKELIEKTIVISDNDYFNILYHFLTPLYLNQYLNSRGFMDVLIFKCFSGCSKGEQLKTTSYNVVSNLDSLKYSAGESYVDFKEVANKFKYTENKIIGERHLKDGIIIEQPYDFNENLDFPLNSLHNMMTSYILDSTDLVWKIGGKNRSFLIQKMREGPADINLNQHCPLDFKIIGFGNSELENSRFQTCSKIGYSYGFISETAFVHDSVSRKNFFLTISMYVNKNKILNDGRYEYKSIATPFMGTLTHIIANQLIGK